MNAKYREIIDLEHHVSKHHPQMTMMQRAAQFAPFAALSGHGGKGKVNDNDVGKENDDDNDEVNEN